MKHTTIKNYSGSQSAINAFKLYSFLFQIIKSPDMYLIAIGKSRFEGILGHFEIHAAFFTGVYFIWNQGVLKNPRFRNRLLIKT